MMEGAFFVSRTDILNWINDLLKLSITKIEQTCTGAVACQIMDAISPGCVPMKKVNWKASQEYEYVGNYKLLQQAFLKIGLKKEIDVPKLIKGKYQDNLEFMQWMKRYYDMRSNGSINYDPVNRRKCPSEAPKKRKSTTSVSNKGRIMKENMKNFKENPPRPVSNETTSNKIEQLTKEVKVLKESNESLQKERDFYFGKMRDLEILLHFYEKQKTPLVENIEKLLYATEDDKVTIDDKGNLIVIDNYAEEKAENEDKMELMQE